MELPTVSARGCRTSVIYCSGLQRSVGGAAPKSNTHSGGTAALCRGTAAGLHMSWR